MSRFNVNAHIPFFEMGMDADGKDANDDEGVFGATIITEESIGYGLQWTAVPLGQHFKEANSSLIINHVNVLLCN